MEYERAREEIANLIQRKTWQGEKADSSDELAKQILSLVEIRSNDQSLPKEVEGVLNNRVVNSIIKMLLTPDPEGNHWVRVIPKRK